ncbi:MAG: DUF5678 domain-containing protein [Nanoarchaeota archaeon]
MKKKHSGKKDLQSHKGEWVAMKGNKVVARSDDPGKVMNIVKEKFPNVETVILKVPEKNQVLLL